MDNPLNSPDYLQKILCISTGHVPKATDEALGRYTSSLRQAILTAEKINYGHLISLPSQGVDLVDLCESVSGVGHPELALLVKLASDSGFTHLRLDSDGLELPKQLNFPTFEW